VGSQLTIEWYQVHHTGGGTKEITFQVILSLDTGSSDGDVVFNYLNINTGDGDAEGKTSTVGIKSAASGPKLVVSVNALNPLVGTGKSLEISGSPSTILPDGPPEPPPAPSGPPAGSGQGSEELGGGTFSWLGDRMFNVLQTMGSLSRNPLDGRDRSSENPGEPVSVDLLDAAFTLLRGRGRNSDGGN